MNAATQIGAAAANRPLLMTSLLGFGVTAVSVAAFTRAPDLATAVRIGDFAVDALIGLAAPAGIAAMALALPRGRLLLAAVIGAFLCAVCFLGPQYAPPRVAAALPAPAAALVGSLLMVWLVAMRPFFGALPGLSAAAPVASVFGAFGAAALVSLLIGDADLPVGAISCLAAALGCAAGIGVATEFSGVFARGGAAHRAAGEAAASAIAPAVGMVLITAVFFGAAVAMPTIETEFSWRSVGLASVGVGLAVAAALFVTTATLSLSALTDAVAVQENHRRRDFREIWRPFKFLLPASTSIAVTAIILIVGVVALFEAPDARLGLRLALAGAGAGLLGVVYVSLRTAMFVFVVLFSSFVVVGWVASAWGAPTPSLVAELVAAAAAACLIGGLGLSWRNARNARRKAHIAVEHAMADGAYGFIATAGFVLAALAIGGVSGLWGDGAAAALWLLAFLVSGGLIAAPVMTAIGAAFSER